MNDSCTVLVIEDDKDCRESLADALSDAAYEVVTAANGQEALERLRTQSGKPCAIVLDLMMPVMDGHAFRVIQRSDPRLNAIPVILLTASVIEDRAPSDMGDVTYLRKPVDLDDLLASVQASCCSPGMIHR